MLIEDSEVPQIVNISMQVIIVCAALLMIGFVIFGGYELYKHLRGRGGH